MELRSRDLVVFDYELEFPHASPIELALYSRGITRTPAVLLDDHAPLGTERRAGIVDVPADRYDDCVDAVAHGCWDIEWARRLRASLAGAIAEVEVGLDALERPRGCAAGTLGATVERLLDLMGFLPLNWLLPLERFARHFACLFDDEVLGRRCLLAQMTPAAPAHMIDFHAYVLSAAGTLGAGGDAAELSSALSAEIGFLHMQGMSGSLERPSEARALLERVAGAADIGDGIEAELARMLAAQRGSRATRAALHAAALLASSRDSQHYARTEAIVMVCRLAAEEEERRKVLQQRALRAFRMIAHRHGLVPEHTTLDELLTTATSATSGR